MKRLMYIVIFLLMAANLLAQETYVIDSVCIGATRTYRIDGDEGDTYEWNIYRMPDSSLYASEVPYIDFMDEDRPAVGDTTWGSEIDQLWDEIGEFDVEVLHWSVHGCDTVEIGKVKVFPAPVAQAGPDQLVCSLEDIVVNADTAWNFSSLLWTSTGDGTFSDPTALHPTYYIGPADSLSGSVQLVITAFGLADNITCEPAVDTVEYFFSDPVISLQVSDVLCYGTGSAYIEATVSGGVAPYLYAWTGPEGFTASDDSIGNLITGTYVLTVTDDNGCSTIDSAFVSQPDEILLTIDSVQNLSCYQSNDGFILASATGGTDTLIFNWEGYSGYTASGTELYNLPADTFIVTVTDANDCEVVDTVIVTEPEPLYALIDSIIDVQCYTFDNGAAHVIVDGGTAPFAYEWDNDPALDSAWAVGLAPGQHTVIITDANNCVAYDTIDIIEPEPLVLSADSLDVRCGGKKPGAIDLHVSGGTPFANAPYYLFEWTDSTGTVFATTEDVDNLAGDQLYTVWVTDSLGCTAFHQVYINEIKNILLTATVDTAKCYGDTWSIDLTVERGRKPYTYMWTDSAGTVLSTDEDLLNVGPGIYWVTVNDKDSCDESMQFIFDPLEELLATITASDTAVCEYGAILLTGNPIGGTGELTHVWTGDGAAYLDRTDSVDVIFSGAAAGNYQLIYTVIDANACTTSDSIDLRIDPIQKDTIYASICANQLPYLWNGNTYDFAGQYIDTISGEIGVGCDTIRMLDLYIEPMEKDTIYASICANQLPYLWNGNTYDFAGQYIDTIPGEIGVGCDTIRMLDLYIEPMEKDTIYASICANQLPYLWNGNTYDFAGQYIDTVPGEIGVGCDTIRMLDLYIEPMEKDTIYASICANQLPYLWNGNTYDFAGQYIDTIPGEIGVGCDTIRMLDLYIEPMEKDTIYASICANQLPYLWNGNTYDFAGQYIDTVPGEIGVGCDTIRMLDLYIEPMEKDTIYASICANQLPYLWNGNTYDFAGQYIDTIPGEIGVGCDTIRMLDLYIEPMEKDTIYASICANQLPYLWNGNTYDFAGQYIDTVPGEIGVGCDTIRMLDLYIEPMEKDTIYASICANQLPYLWNGNTYDFAGQYIDTIPGEIGVGCDTIRMLDLYIEPMEKDTIYASICANQLPYLWNGNTYDFAGQYIDTVPGEIGVGCDTIRMLDLYIEPMEKDTIYASICANQLPYLWNGNTYDFAGQYIDTIPGEIGVGCDTIRMLDLYIEPMEKDTIYASICANQLPYLWNGNTYDFAGQYIDTVPGEIGVGCDTIRMLDLYIEPMEEDTIYASICANELPFDWNGNTYMSAGQYIDTIPGEIGVGCDTIRMLDLYIEPMEEDTIYASICANELPFDWNGNTYMSAGQYIDTIPGEIGVGCDTIRMLDLYIEPMEEDTIYASICANELPFDWNGNTYMSAGQYIDTIPGEIGVGCDTIRMLDLYIEPMEEDTIYASVCANELPYNWLGTDYTAAGQYIDTIPGEIGVGCDTIRMLDLYIEPMEEDTIYASICANELPYNWLGTEYTTAGQYIDTIPGEIGVGCDTIRMLDLYIEPMEEDTIYASICANELPFDWNGNTYMSAGQYIDTIPGEIGVGCDTIRMLDLYIEPMEEDTIYASICANELPFDWNGNTYMSAGQYIDTIPGEIGVGCDTIRVLDLFIEPMEEDTMYLSLCTDELPYDWNGNAITSAGQYLDTIPGIIGIGCDTLLSLFVEVHEPDTVIMDSTLCQGAPTFAWNGHTVLTDQDSSYEAVLVNQFGCDSLLTLNVFIIPPSYTTESMTLCLDDPSVPWNGYDIVSTTDSSYVATLKNSEGCDSVVTMNVTILYPTYSEETIQVCENDPDFDWNGNTILTDRDDVYYATLTNSVGCDSLLTLIVESNPISTFEMDTTLCVGAPSFVWNGETITTDQDDSYQVTLQNRFNCDSLVTLNVYVVPPDTTYLDTALCEGDPEFVWYSNTIQTSFNDQYEARLNNRYNCDSLLILNVEIIPNSETIVDTTLCYETPAFAWNNLTVYAQNDSTYLDTLVNAAGCDSLLTLNVTIVYPDTTNLDTTICEGEPIFAWGVNTVHQVDSYTDSIYTDILQNQYGCDSTVNLNVRILRPAYLLDTIEVCENEPVFTWHSINIFTDRDSIYSDTLYYEAGCDSLRLQLTLISNPVTDTILDTTLCEGSPEFVWNNVPIQTDFSEIYYDTLPGANQFGCDSFLVYDVTILPAMKDTITETICYGEPLADWYGISVSNEKDSVYIYNAPGPAGCDTLIYYEVTVLPVTDSMLYLTLCAGAPDTTLNNVTITSDQSWIYFDTIPNSYGCDSLLTYDVTIIPPDTTYHYDTLCVGDPGYDWNGYTVSTIVEDVYVASLSTAAGCDSVAILTTTLINGTTTYDTVYACTEYTWTEGTGDTYYVSDDYLFTLGSGTDCPDTTWLHLVISNPVIVADSVNVLCYGDSTGSIDIEVTGGVEPYSYLWSNGETTQDISGLPAGIYTVTVTDALADTLGCSANLTVTIEQPEELEITLVSITDVLIIGESTGSIEVTVSGGTPGYTYAWTNEAGDTVSITEDLFNQPAGDYALIVTDDNDCQATFTATITEPIPLQRYMSPVVTPICYEDRNSYPLLDSLKQYIALHPDVDVFSLAGLDTSTFTLDSVVIGGSTYCYEEIRTYSIQDSAGETLSATHRIIVDDREDPTISCPPDLTVDYGVAPNPATTLEQFRNLGGLYDDNCEVVSFRHVSDVSDGGSDPEIITRTYEVADYCGNTAQCEQIISVYESSEFVLICPNLPSYSFECDEVGDIPRYNTLEEFEQAGGVAYSSPYDLDTASFTSTRSTRGSCPQIITITYYIKNKNGDETNCEQIFEVDDTKPPVITMPVKEISCTDPIPYYPTMIRFLRGVGNDYYDNCTDWREARIYYQGEIVTGSCPTLYERTYRFVDQCGNETIAVDRIYVHDTIPPQIDASFPTEISAECDVPDPYTNVNAYVMEDCGPLEIDYRDSLGGIDEPGVVYRIYTFSDPCNSVDIIQKITIELTNIPEFDGLSPLCQFSPSPELPDTSRNGIVGHWEIDSIPTDVVGTFTYVFYPDSGQCAGPADIVVEILPAIDLTETHIDQAYDPNPVGSIDLGIDGGSGVYTINWTGPNGFTASTETITGLYAGDYWVEVSDNIGCYDSISVTLLAFEPEFYCPPDTMIECPDVTQYPAATNITEFIAMGGYYDPVSILADLSSFDQIVPGANCLTVERTYVVEDIYGRLDSCTQTIDFYDIIPPVIVAPDGDTAECLSTIVPDIETFADFLAMAGADAYDPNCSIDPSSFTVRDTAIILGPGRSQVIFYYSIADLCGNIGRDTSYYLITDDQAPEVFCADITVYLDENGQYQITIQDSITMVDSVYDNCTAPEDMVVVIEIEEITCEDVESGTQARIIVYDEGGLSAECTANITVVDTVPPTAICQDITVYLDDTGVAYITAQDIDNGSFDNCELDTIMISRDRFDCFDVGENEVELYAVDAYGLRDTCIGIVTVIDPVDPYIACLPLQTVQLDEYGLYQISWDMVTDSVSDECGIDTVLLDDYELDCDNIGLTTITVTAYDVNGNSSTCEAQFEVFGNIPPNVVNDTAVTSVNIPVEIPVTQNDYDLKTNINLESLGVLVGPSHGSVVVDKATGIVTYTPDLDYEGPDIFRYQICDDGIPCVPECGEAIVFITVRPANDPPVAVDDYYEVPCGDLFGNIILNDSDPDGDEITVNPVPVTPPDSGYLELFPNGNFEYIPFEGFFGTDSFQYVICDNGIPSLCDTAWVYITRVADNDCDGVADTDDIDDDNDGIRDNIENGGYWPEDGMGLIDSDHDGIPDYMDIDSDNDGIVDNIEGQGEHNYIPPSGIDENGDGWDDIYDVTIGGVITFDEDLTDTDGDSMPDYLDIDSDNDGVWDLIEGHDDDHNGIADVLRWYSDEDHDGLDDAYDTYSGWADYGNETASNAPLQDFDGDGTRDWRDTNDEDDEYPTVIEDLNGNGDYSDDDLDLDGYPEYLDTELNCELFIPEGFSPNDDGVHDFFQILCIQKYPNAKLMIFNRNGVKLWEKEHYGNLDVWGTYEDAWWWGTSENRLTIGHSGGLPAGNYIYVLILNDGLGTVMNGTVMLAY
ncbi:Ig-like domain-containing protein [uncultured Draconibacterium sp.]|uniref:Ig-like domain-containing protein n=1 Tax=uncultured Draconibacterium sp. TaxID=1573823 RepID=UPI002AA60463|nr:Ig-like domain-containing protein [uncultured Draconibacterium sp.]